MTVDDWLFEVVTPLGFIVRCSQLRWQEILLKHPPLVGREQDVKRTLAEPDEIRRSNHDDTVALFYCVDGKRWLCVLVNRDTGILITAYPTDAVKQGEVLWNR